MNHRFLVVEDDPGLLVVYSTVLAQMGHEPLVAKDGREAIAQLAEIRPAAVLLDMRLPNLSGEAVLAFVAEQPHLEGLPILIISSNQHYAQYADNRTVFFQLKPVLPGQIRDFVGSLGLD